MKGNLGIVSVHHIKLNEKFLQREKMAEEATVKQGDIEKTGGNGKKKKTTSTLFSLVDVPANLQRSDKRERD